MKGKQFILILMMVSCAVYAQGQGHQLAQKVTVSFKEATVADALKKLEDEVDGLVFMYSPSTLDIKRKVTLSFDQKSLEEVLSQIFEGFNIEFYEKKNKLLLKPIDPQEKQMAGGTVSATAKVELKASSKGEKLIPRRKRVIQPAKAKSDLDALSREQSQDSSLTTGRSARLTTELLKLKIDDLSDFYLRKDFHIKPTLERQYLREPPTEKDSSNQKEQVSKRHLAKEKRLEERANEAKKFRIYGASYTGYTNVNGRAGIQLGGSLIWLKNKRWGFGFSGYAIQSAVTVDPIIPNQYRLAGGYGGVSAQYTLNPNDRIHLSFPLMIGGGGIAYSRINDVGLGPDDVVVEASKAFFALESGAILEANVIKYLRVGFGLSYRLTSNALLNYRNDPGEIASSSSLTGLNFGITVKFGVF